MISHSKAEPHILITGGAGFIGSNFIQYFPEEHKSVRPVNLDKLTYSGNLSKLDDVKDNERHIFIKGDIGDPVTVRSIFNDFEIQSVIHFAGESHVDKSIENPDNFIKTNIEDTFVLLETARQYWNPEQDKLTASRFHHISTDEVYGSLGKEDYFTEKTPYAPNSPYSASKAASDFLVRSYHHTYGLNVVPSNSSSNFGSKQYDENLIPTIIRHSIKRQNIPIYGDGGNVRDRLFVEDHCRAIDLGFHNGRTGQTYLIGGDNECNNLYIALKICKLLDNLIPKAAVTYSDQISFVQDRPRHVFRYATNASKIKEELQWQTVESFDSGLGKTVGWYLAKYKYL